MKPNWDSQSVSEVVGHAPLMPVLQLPSIGVWGQRGLFGWRSREKFWGEAQWHAFYALPDPVGSKRAKGKGVLQSGANRAPPMKDFMRF